jgi:hypothetical protein
MIRALAFACAVALAHASAWAQASLDSSPTATEVAAALGPLARTVEQSTRVRGPVAGDVGQYTITLAADGREVGAYVRTHRFPIDRTPPIWINVIDDLGQVVLRVRDGRFAIDKIPSDWIASDYLRERNPQPRTISFIALNPRRSVRVLAGGETIVAETAFVTSGISPNLLGRTTFRVDPKAKQSVAFTAMAYRTRDEAEARALLEALERGLPKQR